MVRNIETFLVPRGTILPTHKFLEGRDNFKKYLEAIKSLNNPVARQTLGKVEFDEESGLWLASSPFINIFAQDFLPKGYEFNSPAELALASMDNPNMSDGIYLDHSIVLFGQDDSYTPNSLFTKDLAEQLKLRGIIPTPENPVRISLKGAKLKESADNQYGLLVDIANAEVLVVPEYSAKNNGRSFYRFDERGVHILEDNLIDEENKNLPVRHFYSRGQGASRAYLNSLNSGSDDGGLGNSNGHGRVGIVSASGANAKILEDKKRAEHELELQYQRDLTDLNERKARALSILRG